MCHLRNRKREIERGREREREGLRKLGWRDCQERVSERESTTDREREKGDATEMLLASIIRSVHKVCVDFSSPRSSSWEVCTQHTYPTPNTAFHNSKACPLGFRVLGLLDFSEDALKGLKGRENAFTLTPKLQDGSTFLWENSSRAKECLRLVGEFRSRAIVKTACWSQPVSGRVCMMFRWRKTKRWKLGESIHRGYEARTWSWEIVLFFRLNTALFVRERREETANC